MSTPTHLEVLQALVASGENTPPESRFRYPPAIARTLGMRLTAIGEGTATCEMETKTDAHANPLGTLHGGVLGDLADLAIGTAHSTLIGEGESFTSVDLQINFFRPVWNEHLKAVATTVHRGRSVTRYVCDVTRADGKLVAQVTSTVMTLRGEKASGR